MLCCFSCIQIFVIPWTVTLQASLSMRFCRQEYWGGLPCLPPEDLPDLGFEPASLVSPPLQVDSLLLSHPGSPFNVMFFSCSVMFDSSRPHGLQHARLPCPSPSPRACSDSCLLSQWCQAIISASVVPFSAYLSQLQGLFYESALCIRWPKCWSFSFCISPSNEYLGLISFRIDQFDLLTVQGTLSHLLQHNSKASVLQCSALFMVQLSHPFMTTGKTIALTRWTFVSKVM